MRQGGLRAIALLLVSGLLGLLGACGGGGGGGGSGSDTSNGSPQSQPALAFSPTALSANTTVGLSATLTVRAQALRPSEITGPVYVLVEDSTGVFTTDFSIVGINSTTFDVTLHTSAASPARRHEGSLRISLCKDANCTAQYPGSPLSLPFSIVVAPQPLSATPSATTTVTVHQGGVAGPVSIAVNGPSGVNWSARSNSPWLQVDGAAHQGTGNLSVSMATGALTAGSHAGVVTVSSDDGQSVDVPFTVQVLPANFVLTSGAPTFTAINGSDIASQTMTFEVDSQAAVAWQASVSQPWLSADPTSGSTPASMTLQVNPFTSALSSGTYSADVTLRSTGIADLTVPVTLELVRPTLSATSNSVTLGGAKGRDWRSASLPFALNTGNRAWTWSLGTLPAWLTSPVAGGSVSASGDTLVLTPDATQVQPGSVSGAVTVTAQVNGDTVQMPVTVNMNADQRRLVPSSYAVALSAMSTGTTLGRGISIRDNFEAGLQWQAQADAAWVYVSPVGSTDGAPVVQINVDPTSLPDQALSLATVTVSTPTAGVESAVIRVAMWKDVNGASSLVSLPSNYSHLVADKLRPYVYASANGTSIDVYNVHSGQRIATIADAGVALGEMSVSADGSRLYAVDAAQSKLVAIDLDTRTVLRSWTINGTVDSQTAVLAVHPNGFEVILLGNGTAYDANGRSLGATGIIGSLAASGDGLHVYAQDSGVSPATAYAFDVDYSAMSGGVLMVSQVATAWSINGSSNGNDIAVQYDNSTVYTAAGSPYQCTMVSPSLTAIRGLEGRDVYPNNAEVHQSGLVACGGANQYGAADFWLYSADGTLLASHKVAGYARGLLPRQLVISADSRVVVTLTDDPLMAFVPTGRVW